MRGSTFFSQWQLMMAVVLVVLVDQVSKFWASENGWTTINSGVSFGLGAALANWSLILGLLVIIMLCLIEARRTLKPWVRWGLCGIAAGGVSNVIDRILHGGVLDWMPVPFLPLTNNLADYVITVSVLLILWQWVTMQAVHESKN